MEYLYFALFIIMLLPRPAYGKIMINEFSPDRTPQAVELINTSSESAVISNWYIDDSGGSSYYTIAPDTILYPNSCLVFESDFNLNKSSADTVRLFDNTALPTTNSAVLIDSYAYKQSAGTGQSYARIPDGSNSWAATIASFGLWNDGGTGCVLIPTPTPSTTPTTAVSPIAPTAATPAPSPLPDRVYISEVYPYPASGETEWVELYNDNDVDIVLDGWFIDDLENGGGAPRSINVSLSAHGYAAIDIGGSLFNNDADSVRLLDPDKKLRDGFEYGKARQQMSLGRVAFDVETVCLEEPSKGTSNNACTDISPSITPGATFAPAAVSFVKSVTPQSVPARIFVPEYGNAAAQTPLVLGAFINADPTEKPAPVATVRSSIPLVYSILTIVSLLIKIKNGLTA